MAKKNLILSEREKFIADRVIDHVVGEVVREAREAALSRLDRRVSISETARACLVQVPTTGKVVS